MAIEMKFKTWLERVESNRFDEWTKENMVMEMPRTFFTGFLQQPSPPGGRKASLSSMIEQST